MMEAHQYTLSPYLVLLIHGLINLYREERSYESPGFEEVDVVGLGGIVDGGAADSVEEAGEAAVASLIHPPSLRDILE